LKEELLRRENIFIIRFMLVITPVFLHFKILKMKEEIVEKSLKFFENS